MRFVGTCEIESVLVLLYCQVQWASLVSKLIQGVA